MARFAAGPTAMSNRTSMTERRFPVDWRWLAVCAALIPFGLLLLFVRAYGYAFPVADQWYVSLPIAAAVQEGTLTWPQLTQVTPAGHRVVFTNLHTAAASHLTHWNVGLETWINPLLALLVVGLVLALFDTVRKGLVFALLVPCSMAVFSVYQDVNWTLSFESSWHFVNLFFLASLLVLARRPPGLLPLGAAAALAACATFSMAHGVVVWPLALLWMWACGYRRPLHFGGWIAAAALAAFGYFARSGVELGASAGWKGIDPYRPLELARVVLANLGAPFALGRHGLATAVGLAALVLLAVLLVRIGRAGDRARRAIVLCSILAGFAAASAAIIGAARLHVLDIATLPLMPRYATTSTLFWVGTSGAALLALRGAPRTRPAWLLPLGVAAGGVLVALHVLTNLQALAASRAFYGNPLWSDDSPYMSRTRDCILDYPLTRDRSCLGEDVDPYFDPRTSIERLAVHGLAPFRRSEPRPMLAPHYRPDSPVLVASDSLWSNRYVRSRLLAEVPGERVLHVLVPGDASPVWLHESSPPGSAQPLSLSWIDRAGIVEASGREVWYVTTPEAATADPLVFAALEEAGFGATELPLRGTPNAHARFRVYRFRRG